MLSFTQSGFAFVLLLLGAFLDSSLPTAVRKHSLPDEPLEEPRNPEGPPVLK